MKVWVNNSLAADERALDRTALSAFKAHIVTRGK